MAGKTLTYKDYTNGNWNIRNSNKTEEELYDFITPNLSDLVYGISIQKTNVSIGYCSGCDTYLAMVVLVLKGVNGVMV